MDSGVGPEEGLIFRRERACVSRGNFRKPCLLGRASGLLLCCSWVVAVARLPESAPRLVSRGATGARTVIKNIKKNILWSFLHVCCSIAENGGGSILFLSQPVTPSDLKLSKDLEWCVNCCRLPPRYSGVVVLVWRYQARAAVGVHPPAAWADPRTPMVMLCCW